LKGPNLGLLAYVILVSESKCCRSIT
jgi:hypothetical protein